MSHAKIVGKEVRAFYLENNELKVADGVVKSFDESLLILVANRRHTVIPSEQIVEIEFEENGKMFEFLEDGEIALQSTRKGV